MNSVPLMTILFALAAPLALLAAETPASKTDAARTPAGRAMLEKLIPDIEGVSKEEMAKFRAASPRRSKTLR